MNTGLLTAWLTGEGVIVWRITREHRPPMPGELFWSSGLFVLLAMLGEAQPKLATTMAWGFVIAAVLKLPLLGQQSGFLGGVSKSLTGAQAQTSAATTGTPAANGRPVLVVA